MSQRGISAAGAYLGCAVLLVLQDYVEHNIYLGCVVLLVLQDYVEHSVHDKALKCFDRIRQ